MKNRIASLLLAIAMIASLSISAMAADQKLVVPTGAAKTYTDVPTTYHFYENIQNVTRAGLFQGTTATEFSPYAYMSRGQFVIVLTRLEGLSLEGVPTQTSFSDVDANYRFSGAIAWATTNSIVTGYSDGTFRPRDPISRAQIAALLHRYLDRYLKAHTNYSLRTVTPEPAQFTDYETAVTLADGTVSTACPAVFREDLDYGRQHGLIAGYSDGSYRPNIPVGRAQVAAMLDRIVLQTTPSPIHSGGGGGGDPVTYEIDLTQEAASGAAITGRGSVTLTLRSGKSGTDGTDRVLSTDPSDTTAEARSLATNTYVTVKSIDPAEGWELSEFYIQAPGTAGKFGKNDKIASKGEGREVTYEADEEIALDVGDDFALKTFLIDRALQLRISFVSTDTPSSDAAVPHDLTLKTSGTGAYTAALTTTGTSSVTGAATPYSTIGTDAVWKLTPSSATTTPHVTLTVDLDDTELKSSSVTGATCTPTSDGTIGGTTDKPTTWTFDFDMPDDTTVTLDLAELTFTYQISAGAKVGKIVGGGATIDAVRKVEVKDLAGSDDFMTALDDLDENDNVPILEYYLKDLINALNEANGTEVPIKDKETINKQVREEVNDQIEDQIDSFIDGLDPKSSSKAVQDGIAEAIQKQLVEDKIIKASDRAEVVWRGGSLDEVTISNRAALKDAIWDAIGTPKFLVDGEEVSDMPVALTVELSGATVDDTDAVTLGAHVKVTAVVVPKAFTQPVNVRVKGDLSYDLTVNGASVSENATVSVDKTTSFNVTQDDIKKDKDELTTQVDKDAPINEFLKASQLAKADTWYGRLAERLESMGESTKTLDALYTPDGTAFLTIEKTGDDLLQRVIVNDTPFVTVTGQKVKLDLNIDHWRAAYDKGIYLVNDLRDVIVTNGNRVMGFVDRYSARIDSLTGTNSRKIGDAAALPKTPTVETVWKTLRTGTDVNEIEAITNKDFDPTGQIGAIMEKILGDLNAQGIVTMTRTLSTSAD